MVTWKSKKKKIIEYINKHILPKNQKPEREYSSPYGYLPHSYLYCLEQVSFLQLSNNKIWEEIAYRSLGIQNLSIDPYYLNPELLEYLLNTDLPEALTTFANVTPILLVYLPTGALLDDDGDSIVVLMIEDYPLWESMENNRMDRFAIDNIDIVNPVFEYMNAFTKAQVQQPRFAIHAITEHGAAFRAPVETNDIILGTLEGLQYFKNGRVDNVLDAIKRIGLNLLLLLQSHPEYITIGHPVSAKHLRGMGFAAKTSNGLRNPRCIGLDINQRIEEDSSSLSKSSTGKKKVTHLRRGHWRRQRVGSQLSSHRFIWMKPILINP